MIPFEFKRNITATTISVTLQTPVQTATTGIPMGWREAESQDIEARIKRAKAQEQRRIKDAKLIAFGPKQARWRT
jgi:hypothetical protein